MPYNLSKRCHRLLYNWAVHEPTYRRKALHNGPKNTHFCEADTSASTRHFDMQFSLLNRMKQAIVNESVHFTSNTLVWYLLVGMLHVFCEACPRGFTCRGM